MMITIKQPRYRYDALSGYNVCVCGETNAHVVGQSRHDGKKEGRRTHPLAPTPNVHTIPMTNQDAHAMSSVRFMR
jgi:hypothetical protein